MDEPLISIITVVYNAELTLESTIKSVLGQQKDLFEYWIIDGGSTDGSLDLIHKYESELAGWISEPDKGIYDAMNKGIERAKGKWLYFLGADDQLNEGIVAIVASNLNSNLVAVYGDVIYDTGDIMHSWLGYGTLMQNTLHHQATFYKRTLFEKFRYNTTYRVISDYELNLQIYLKKQATLFIPYIIATCGSTGTSSILSTKEVNDLRSKYVKNKLINYALNTMLEFYYFYFKSKRNIRYKLNKLPDLFGFHRRM